MATRPSRTPSCRKRGLILTCYVDGKKRFKALPIDAEQATTPPTLDRETTRTDNPTNVSLATGAPGVGA